MKKAGFLFLAVVLLFSFVAVGCKGSSSNDVSGPSAPILNPTGTIQGRLIDAVTQQPVAGAVIDIGVSQGTTNADGQFVIYNVPATTDALNGTVGGSYQVTINMKNVTSPVLQTSTTATYKYSDYYFKTVAVNYTSLNDTSADGNMGGNGTNHDTPVTGLVATANFTVGKMAATVTGVVAGCQGADFFAAKGTGYTVRLISTGSDNAASGEAGNVIATASTDANGVFTFAKIESLQSFWICAVDANNTVFGCADGDPSSAPTAPNFKPGDTNMNAVVAPADGVTTQLAIQNSNAVHVCSTDIHGPAVTLVSPEPGSDIAPSATQTVKFKFSEAVLMTALTSTSASAVGNLYDKIEVGYAGAKAGNLAYTLDWNATFDELTVTFATAPSGKYYVRIAGMEAAGYITDAAGNHAVMGACPDDTVANAAIAIPGGAIAGTTDCTAFFTTNGGPTAAKPVIALTNAASLDNVGGGAASPSLDWLPVSGANGGYNVYRRMNQDFGTSVQSGPYERVAGPITATAWADGALGFDLNGSIKVTYDYIVTGLNSDMVEGPASDAVNAADKMGPTFAGCTCTAGAAGVGTLTVDGWDEALDKASANTALNYAQTAPLPVVDAVAKAVYDPLTNSTTLTFSGALACGGKTLTVTSVKDVSGNNNRTTPANINTCAY
ncbi:MAG: hypothetical protein M0042_13000 [Nitrospiraceae bacterium]|nr:hypothetical protein [Nitrospiraceae bacterium]